MDFLLSTNTPPHIPLQPRTRNGTWAFTGNQFIRAIVDHFNPRAPTSLTGGLYNAVDIVSTTSILTPRLLSFDFTFTAWTISHTHHVMIFQEPVTPTKSVPCAVCPIVKNTHRFFFSTAAMFHFYDLHTGRPHSLHPCPMNVAHCQPYRSLQVSETSMAYCSDDWPGYNVKITVVNWTTDKILSVRIILFNGCSLLTLHPHCRNYRCHMDRSNGICVYCPNVSSLWHTN
jgi:hypothetical protein